jgi:TatD DNase family protein
MLYDAHNHLQDPWLLPHRSQVFKDLARIPLARAVVNGTAESDWPEVTLLAHEHAFIRPSYGLHPWHVGNATPGWRDAFVRTLDQHAGAAIGEIGLDRWILERAKPDDSRLAGLRRAMIPEQIDAFAWQLRHAAERNLPVTIHCIDAWGPLAEVLRASPRPARGFLLHAYGGSAELARQFAALGAYFSFNGYFLAARHSSKRAVFASLPADRLLAETDAPAMPLPREAQTHRLPGLADGNPINHPGNIGAVYAGLAAIRNLSVETLEPLISENVQRLFG